MALRPVPGLRINGRIATHASVRLSILEVDLSGYLAEADFDDGVGATTHFSQRGFPVALSRGKYVANGQIALVKEGWDRLLPKLPTEGYWKVSFDVQLHYKLPGQSELGQATLRECRILHVQDGSSQGGGALVTRLQLFVRYVDRGNKTLVELDEVNGSIYQPSLGRAVLPGLVRLISGGGLEFGEDRKEARGRDSGGANTTGIKLADFHFELTLITDQEIARWGKLVPYLLQHKDPQRRDLLTISGEPTLARFRIHRCYIRKVHETPPVEGGPTVGQIYCVGVPPIRDHVTHTPKETLELPPAQDLQPGTPPPALIDVLRRGSPSQDPSLVG